jgi:hypothetical protein
MPERFGRNLLLLGGISLATVGLGSLPASASQGRAVSGGDQIGYSANAYGTGVKAAGIGASGPSAFSSLGAGCVAKPGVSNSNRVAGVHLKQVLDSGTVATRVASKKTHDGDASTGSARTEHVSALRGLIKATAIKAVSTTSRNSTTGAFTTSAAGTKFVGLVIAGHHIGGSPKPNTRISVPGIGYVILNQQTPVKGSIMHGMAVFGVHLVVTKHNKRAPVGAQLWVSAVTTSLTSPVKGVLVGNAFGSRVNVGHLVVSSRSFPVALGCGGTGGRTISNSALSTHIPSILKTGTIRSTAYGKVSAGQVSAKLTSRVQGVDLLGGTVTATAVKAGVTARGNPPKLGDQSTFVNLKIRGKSLLNVKPNTKLHLKGLGTLWLHRVVKTGNSISVIMIQLVIGNRHNSAHLPKGAEVSIAVAHVGVL